MTIRWQPDAVEEVNAIAAFYQEKQQGLEQRFLEVLEDALRRIGHSLSLYTDLSHSKKSPILVCTAPNSEEGKIGQ